MKNNFVPLSQTQLGIYLECMRMGEGAYNLHWLYTIDNNVNMKRLAGAFEETVKANPSMNVRIMEENGEPYQYIPDEIEEYKQNVLEITEDEWQKTLPGLVAEPLKLIGGRLFNFVLVKTEKAKYFLLILHHVNFDGTAINKIFEDVSAAYNGQELKHEQYNLIDSARDEVSARKSPEYDTAKKWYEEKFSGLEVESMPLPDLHGENSHGIFEYKFNLPYDDIKNFCHDKGLNASGLTSGAFSFLMGTYTHQNEALFSTIYHGRKDERTKNIIGMFVKTFPVYCRWNKESKVVDVLQELTQQIKDSRKNDIYSFADINKICPMADKPFFAYHGMIRTHTDFCGLPCYEKTLDKNATGSEISIELMCEPDGMKLRIEYNSGKYSEQFVKTLAETYENILRQLMTKEYMRDIIPVNDEQLAILDKFNDTERPYDASQTVVSLFKKAVKENAERTAVIFNDKKFTYKEVDEISDKIAACIASKNIGRGDVVSILIPRGEFQVTASLGALKAGCAYQPLDSTYPPERLNFMVKDSSAKFLITTEELKPLVPDYDGEILLLSEINSLPAPSEALKDFTKPDDLFILLYTSGSTGIPKGVRLTHKNLVCFINWYHRFYELKNSDCVGQYASYGFDACMMDMYPALTKGAAVCIIPEEIRLNLAALNEYLEANSVSHQFMTTQVGRQFAVDVENHSLKYLSVGGEKLVSLNPPANYKFFNGYGPTECTIFTNIFHVTENEDNIPIGKPLDNMKLYVVSPESQRLPVGALGELLIAGPQVGDGYLNRPDKTKEVFVDNPFGEGKIYKTGDIVRYRPDGNIEFLGRRDGQVKIHGFRIELSEVEAVIRDFTGIKDATVAAFDDESGKYLAAYVVSDEKIDVNALNEFIRSQKPPYMIPSVTMQIEKIPLNQNHKVDRRALPKPEFKSTATEETKRPLNILEKELSEITGKIIGVDEIPVTAPLINIGLNSILSIKLSFQIYKRFGVEIQSSILLNGASIEEIENIILQNLLNNDKSEKISEGGKINLNEVPMSYPQMGVYYDCMKRPAEVIYNIPSMFVFSPDTDAKKLSEALKAIVEAHPALSIYFQIKDGVPVQVKGDYKFNVETLNMTEQEFENYKKNFVRPFDLSKGPLYRFSIIRTNENLYLLCDFHHLVFDGASLGLFMEELGSAIKGTMPKPENYTYFDYAADEKEFEKTEQFEANKKFFAEILKDFESSSEITADLNGREENGAMKTAASSFNFSEVNEFCRKQGITPASFFLAASFYTVSRFVNDRHVYLSTISSGRSDVRLADTFGMFVNTLPLGIEINDETAGDFLKRSAEVFNGTIRHEKYPFARIALDYDFVPNIMYAYQIGVMEEKGGLKLEPLELKLPKFKVEIFIEERDGEACVTVNYNNALYSEALMQNLARSIVIAAEGIMTAPEKKIRDLSLLDSEQLAILDSFNATEVPYDKSQTIVSLFRKAAKENANRTAVIFNDIKLTYRELDDITDKLAGTIANKGLGRSDVVSILIPRNEYMPIASIGALKAGCAYQPLDPTYPPERLNFMVKDSGAKLLITIEELRPLLTDYNGDVLMLKDIPSLPALSVELSEPKPEDLFILLYTSGSTGTPKGVRLTHGNLVCFVDWYNRYYELHTEDCEGQYASFGFDAGMQDICSSMALGATLCIIPEEIRLDLNAINEYMERHHITHQFMTTQVARQFAVNIENHTLKTLVCGGEKLVPFTPPAAYKFQNGYGPTECTCCVAVYHVKEYMENIPIGKAIDNVKLYIVDSEGKRVPVGALGELWIAGLQVGNGYLNLPDKTAEVFIDNPFNSDPDYNRVYKTGDIVRYMADGNIEFFGRRDGQVKIRGFRIELSEVESVIRQFPGITDATVAAFDNEFGEGKYLAAYVVSDEKIDIKALNDFIKSQKPPYMVPAVTMQIDKIPLTQNSKVNKRALPKAVVARSVSEIATNDVERAFCKIFGSILQLDNVGATENFFSIGGTSILVTLVLIEAEKAGYRVTFQDVFSRPTPRLLAELFTESAPKTERESVKDEVLDYDYGRLKSVLDTNTLENFKTGASQHLGDILLTGATGYLGAHILHELLERYDGKVYCLLRGKGRYTAERRLKNQLFYYFEKPYDEILGKRLFVVEGDVTKPIPKLPVSTVINCAAVVKHFSAGTEIEDVNIGGVSNLIEYCFANNARLIQVSTVSTVSTVMSKGKSLANGRMIGERDLYFGQSLDNKYVRSKFLAERLILEAVAEKGLSAKIMRVGNLAARYSDGEFQINYGTNSAMGHLKIYALLGVCPYEQMDVPMEFSPVDEVAKAILLLCQTPRECVIFHPYNHDTILSGNVFGEMKKLGLPVNPVEREAFDEMMKKAEDDPVKAKLLTSMLAYQNGDRRGASVPCYNAYTMQTLYRMGYRWPVTSLDYVEQFIKAIKGLGFFEF